MKMRAANFLSLLSLIAKLVCRLILPLSTVLILLIMPNYVTRELVFNSIVMDWIIRVFLVVFFCVNYWYLPVLFDPKLKQWLWISDTVLKNPALLNGYYICMTIGYGFFIACFTYYSFSHFLPLSEYHRFISAIINALIFVIFFLIRYDSFIKLATNQNG